MYSNSHATSCSDSQEEPNKRLRNLEFLSGNELPPLGNRLLESGWMNASAPVVEAVESRKMSFITASGLLPAGIAVYVQRKPNGVLWKRPQVRRIQACDTEVLP